MFVLLVSGATPKRANRSKGTESGHDEICPVYRYEFAGSSMLHDFFDGT